MIQNGTIRKLGCSFLFAFHSNYCSVLHHLLDKARYWLKIVIFSFPLAFDAPVKGVPVGVCQQRRRAAAAAWQACHGAHYLIIQAFITHAHSAMILHQRCHQGLAVTWWAFSNDTASEVPSRPGSHLVGSIGKSVD